MKSSTTHSLRAGNVAASTPSDGLTLLKREAQAWVAAMPITVLVSAVLSGLRESGKLR